MPRNARRYIRCAGVVAFYVTAVFSLEYVIILGHMQHLVEEKSTEDARVLMSHPGDKAQYSPRSTRVLPAISHNISQLKPVHNETVPFQNKHLVTDKDRPIDSPALQPKKDPPSPSTPAPRKAIPDTLPEHERRRLAEEAEWEKTYYRLKPTKVNPYLYDYVVRPNNLCDQNTSMLVLVHSYHSYEDRRMAIRKTWGSVARGGDWPRRELKGSVRLAFVLGRHKDPGLDDLAKEEAEAFNDIIQGSFIDAYNNMTLKSLLGLRFFIQHCPQAKVLLKSDDDMIINIPWLLDVLDKNPMSRSIMGPLNRGARVYRTGKWKLPKDVFPFKYYPAYESGAAYVIAGDLVADLFETSEYVPSIFIDDVYITGILGKILNVTHVFQKGFAYWVDRQPTSCDINEDRKMTGTKMKPEILTRLWEDIEKDVRNCPTPPPRKHPPPPKKPITSRKRSPNT